MVHQRRWRYLAAAIALASVVWMQRAASPSSAVTVSEGPLIPVANGTYTSWNRVPTSLLMYQTVADTSCVAADAEYVATSTGSVRFSTRLALGPANNGKDISRIDIAICYRAGASAGAAFAPFVRLDGANYDGSSLTAASTTECQETVQSITLPAAVAKSDTTVLEIGAVKLDGDTKTVRVCSIRATVYYEDDEPPPPLPTVAKAPADLEPSAPGIQSVDATRAYWDVTVDNSAANAVARTGLVVTDGFADAVLESAEPSGACPAEPGIGSPWVCDVAAGGSLVLRVSRPRAAVEDACAGGTLTNFIASATLSDETPLEITAGGVAAPVAVTIPADASACDPVLVTKTLLTGHSATVSDPADVAWQVSVSNPAGGLDGAAVWVRDEGMAVTDGPSYSIGVGYCSGDVASTAGAACLLPAGVTVVWAVSPPGTIEQTCAPQTFVNTASYRFDSSAEWSAAPGPSIELAGDISLCTRAVQVCLVVEDNEDGVVAPDGGEFRFANDANAQTIVLEAFEGNSVCGSIDVPVGAVSIFQSPASSGDRPGSNGLAGTWSGDADGYPRAFVGTGSCGSAPSVETALLGGSDTSVTFCNKPEPRTKSITVESYYFPPTVPVVRPALAFSDPEILPVCTAEDEADGSSTTWSCLVPADWSGVVTVTASAGWVDGPCPGDLEPSDAYHRSCSNQTGELFVRVAYELNGVPLAEADIPVVTINGVSLAPNPPATTSPTVWGPATVNPLLSHAAVVLPDGSRWQSTGTPALSGDGCTWASTPGAGATETSVAVPPGGDCVVTFVLERLVATLVVHQLYLNAPGESPEFTVEVDGSPEMTPWATTGSPPTRWQKTVSVSGTGSGIAIATLVPPGWANVAAFAGDCSGFSGPPAPIPDQAVSVLVQPVTPGDTIEVCFVSVAVGTVVLVVNETHGTAGPETWNFTTTSSAIGSAAITTPANPLPEATPVSSVRTFELVPAGSYSIAEIQARTACEPGATAADFETRAAALIGSPPSDPETATVIGPATLPFAVVSGQTTYIRFDNVGCGTVLATGAISIRVVSDFDGDGAEDPGEPSVPGWPVTVSGPDGEAALVTDADGQAVYSVVTGGKYTVRQTAKPGWLATAPVEADVVVGLGETAHVTFRNQPRVSVSATMTEISPESPGGASGAGWTFQLKGCGESRTLATGASGKVTFSDLPPALGCVYTVTVGARAGWAALSPEKTAAPTAAGQTTELAFTSVRIDACTTCSPTTGGTAPGPVLPLASGSNLVTWPGAKVTVANALGGDAVIAIYQWDPESGKWRRYFPALPRYLSDLETLEPGAAYWVIMARAGEFRVGS